MWENLLKITKKSCVFIFFCTAKFGYNLIHSNPSYFRYDLVWKKNIPVGFLSANKIPLRKHELMYVFSKQNGGKKTYNPQKTIGKPYVDNKKIKTAGLYQLKNFKSTPINNKGDRYPVSILEFKTDKKKIHPTQKPVSLCEWLVKSYSNEGETILDFTMGSGTTGVACINTGRKFIGVEMDKEIYETAKKRLKETEEKKNE